MTTADETLQWLIETIARATDVPTESIDPDRSVHTLGIDSALMISLAFALEDRFGVELDAAPLFAQPSLRALANQLAQDLADRQSGP